jgi:hypothetical protein
MPLTSPGFVSKWKRLTAREKQTYQEYFIDLWQWVGHQTPNDYDPTGRRFGFEMGAAVTGGGQGQLIAATIEARQDKVERQCTTHLP